MDNNFLMFNNGTLYYDDTKISEDDNITYELSANERAPMHINLSSQAEFSGEVKNLDIDLLNQLAYVPLVQNREFVMYHYFPIMIQARWHKKKRINKKWLKRYGMKYDHVQVQYIGTILEYAASGDVYEIGFDADKMKYLWRPDQKRRGCKIEV